MTVRTIANRAGWGKMRTRRDSAAARPATGSGPSLGRAGVPPPRAGGDARVTHLDVFRSPQRNNAATVWTAAATRLTTTSAGQSTQHSSVA